jgi:hypothetical protein
MVQCDLSVGRLSSKEILPSIRLAVWKQEAAEAFALHVDTPSEGLVADGPLTPIMKMKRVACTLPGVSLSGACSNAGR